jgi:hypothetical protein
VAPRSRLWIGTALSKDGEHGHSNRVMSEAAREFEDLGEAEDWSVAQRKLALAFRHWHPRPGLTLPDETAGLARDSWPAHQLESIRTDALAEAR